MTIRFTVVTILPELIAPSLTAGVVGRAAEAGTIAVDTVNPRDFTHDRHRTVDDNPYGGGPGMVMKAEPLLAAIASACEPRSNAATSTARTGAASASLGQRVMKKVESTLARWSTPASLAHDDGSHAADAATSAAAHAEATIAELEAQLRGERPAGPTASGAATAAIAAKASDSAPAPTNDDADAEATLAELEMELGMRAPPADLASTVRRTDEKMLGPALDEKVLGPALAEELPATATAAAAATATATATATAAAAAAATATATATATAAATASAAPESGSGSGSASDPAAATASGSGSGSGHARPHRILLSPSGKTLTQARVRELATLPHIVLVCGRYEGIDQRVIDTAIDEELSIGDYVLSGGELAALVVIDAVARYVPGVLGEATSTDEESFSAGMLEYPQYTRPQTLAASTVPAILRAASTDEAASTLADQPVPPILQSGNHAAIAAWRRQQSIERTAKRRPDLFRHLRMTKADSKLYPPLRARTHIALVHHPVVDRVGTVITTAITNFDIHDLARSAMTYGLAGYHIVTPITSQREKAANIATLWIGDEKGEHRAVALRLVRTAESIASVVAALTNEHGRPPQIVATSAKPGSFPGLPRRSSTELVAESSLDSGPLLLLLGTGWGLAEELIPSVSRVLAPIEGDSDWNHLSVRSAAAIILDRLFGRPA